MRKQLRFGGFLPLLAILALSIASTLAMAKDYRSLKLEYPVKINGAEVPAGVYKITWGPDDANAELTLAKGKEVVGTLAGKWVDRGSASRSDTVVYDANPDGSRRIAEIRFAGSNRVLVVGQDSTSTGM
jgi:hypothetical protein